MGQLFKLSNGTVVTVKGLSLEECHQALAPDMDFEAFKSLVRNPGEYQGDFEGVDNQVRTGYLDVVLPVHFGSAPDFDEEAFDNWAETLFKRLSDLSEDSSEAPNIP